MDESTLEKRAVEYAALCGIRLDSARRLGDGTDGIVWRSSRETAIKALQLEKNYKTERDCYQRFKAHRVLRIGKFAIPELIGCDDRLLIVEMRIVTPPYILDFAKAWLDRPPDFSEITLDDWQQEAEENFGENWAEVRRLLFSLQRFGIYYYDAKPGNIVCDAPFELS